MANFLTALQFTLKHEGSKLYIDHLTNERSRWGITQKLLIEIKFVPTDPDLLTMLQVEEIYQKFFWNINRLDEISSQLIASKVFDMAVNMGNRQAVKLLQASLNSVGGQTVIDGVLGPFTVVSVNEFLKKTESSEERLLTELVLKSVSFYHSLAANPKSKIWAAKSLKGWLARAEDIGIPEVDKSAFNQLRDGSKDKTIKG